ncbi:MAG: hypothetical protein JWO84_327 [Parcubacteria group bacterium]|nr:hypothetical protein [Parcubacteria group bacterium]
MAVPQPTQAFVPVKEVRNGIVILKEDGYRGIMMCSAMNFALKSEDEQTAIIRGFQSFLNTLDFSVEVVVHSRKMDIRPYLALLEERLDAQQSELMRIQLREYIQFIKGFMDSTEIMTKLFYTVVPYSPALGLKVAQSFHVPGTKKATASEQGDNFEEDRIQLEQRMALVSAGLSSAGIRAVALSTEEIIELLYRSFNIGQLESPIHLDGGAPSRT